MYNYLLIYFFGKNNYQILETPIPADDPLNWVDTKSYKERLKIAQANKAIKDAKKAKDFDARDKAQLEKAEIKAGRDDAKTGTALSRAYNRFLVKKNKKQLEKREKKRQKEAEKNKA